MNKFRVSLPLDESGFLGRECPSEKCRGYFKIKPGTGLPGNSKIHCPYCGFTAEINDFTTEDQIRYAKSLAIREISKEIVKELKKLEFDSRPTGPLGIGISLKVKPARPLPIFRYREKSLETSITCSSCGLGYAVFGVFAFCPDCGQHNSLQILSQNHDIILRMLDIAANAENEVSQWLIGNALEDCVSSFDGFGRRVCYVYRNSSSNPKKALEVSFQNLEKAKEKIIELFGIDLSNGVNNDEWQMAKRAFQKRHLLAHRMGVIDEEYVRKSGDISARVGRKVIISEEEIRQLIEVLGKLTTYFVNELAATLSKPKEN